MLFRAPPLVGELSKLTATATQGACVFFYIMLFFIVLVVLIIALPTPPRVGIYSHLKKRESRAETRRLVGRVKKETWGRQERGRISGMALYWACVRDSDP